MKQRLKLKEVVVEGKREMGAKSMPRLVSPLMKGQDSVHKVHISFTMASCNISVGQSNPTLGDAGSHKL